MGAVQEARERLAEAQRAMSDLEDRIAEEAAKLRELQSLPVTADNELTVIGQERVLARLRGQIGSAQAAVDAAQQHLGNVQAERKRLFQALEGNQELVRVAEEKAALAAEVIDLLLPVTEKLGDTPFYSPEAESRLDQARRAIQEAQRLRSVGTEHARRLAEYDGDPVRSE